MLALVLFTVAVFAIPFSIVIVLPIWAAINMRRGGRAWHISLLPLVLPVAALGSEAVPKWWVETLAHPPLAAADGERVTDAYVKGGVVDAALLMVRHPHLAFTEGVRDNGDTSYPAYAQGFARLPTGTIRFRGRRSVDGSDVCAADEVRVLSGGFENSPSDHWYCTKWQSIPSPTSAFELRQIIRRNGAGPWLADVTIDEIIKRRDGRRVRAAISASVPGGIARQLFRVVDFFPGDEGRARYHASTLGNVETVCQEAYLLEGKAALKDDNIDCQPR